ncbi:MAG: hypothetical protein LBP63_01570, partial [Prevotellaceae bacterium]|nr:hypothetical protein [Prevotellaceae bacterium]
MKNIFACTSHCCIIAKLFLTFFCIILNASFINAQTRRVFNINNENSLQYLIRQEKHPSLKNMFPQEVENYRPFEYNLQLKNFTSQNKG